MSDILTLSKFEERIYNTHLKVARTRRNLPFKYRKDFSSLDDATKLTLKKIAIFLSKHNHINLDEYICAPYKIYKDEEFFELSYYNSLKAVKAYTLYHNSMLYEDPDSDEQINNIVKSLKFIQDFCKNRQISLDQYLKYADGNVPSFITHLQEHRVNLFTLLGFKNFIKEFKSVDSELVKFIIGEEVYNRVEVSRTKLFSSKKAMKLITLGLQKIQKHLNKS